MHFSEYVSRSFEVLKQCSNNQYHLNMQDMHHDVQHRVSSQFRKKNYDQSHVTFYLIRRKHNSYINKKIYEMGMHYKNLQ